MDVGVIGAGPAGLALAAETSRAGLPTTVYERSSRVGGLARSFDGWATESPGARDGRTAYAGRVCRDPRARHPDRSARYLTSDLITNVSPTIIGSTSQMPAATPRFAQCSGVMSLS